MRAKRRSRLRGNPSEPRAAASSCRLTKPSSGSPRRGRKVRRRDARWGPLREEPGGVAVGGEELDDGLEVDGALLLVECRTLGATVLEKFLALGGSDKLHGFDSCLGGPQRSVHGNSRTAQGPPGIERSSSIPDQ